jgi:hypothetical protein
VLNGSLRRQKTLQPVVEPLFRLSPLGVMLGENRGIKPFHALLEVPAVRTSRCVFRHGFFHSSAGIVIGSRQECRSLRTGSGTGPLPQQLDDLLEKVFFVPTGHFNWGIPSSCRKSFV